MRNIGFLCKCRSSLNKIVACVTRIDCQEKDKPLVYVCVWVYVNEIIFEADAWNRMWEKWKENCLNKSKIVRHCNCTSLYWPFFSFGLFSSIRLFLWKVNIFDVLRAFCSLVEHAVLASCFQPHAIKITHYIYMWKVRTIILS